MPFQGNLEHPSYRVKKLRKSPLTLQYEETQNWTVYESVKTGQADFGLLYLDSASSDSYMDTFKTDGFTIGQKRFNATNPLVTNGDLKYLPILDSGFEMFTGFIYSKLHPQGTAIKKFIEFAKDFL